MRRSGSACFVLLFLFFGGVLFAQESRPKADSAPRSAWRFDVSVIEIEKDKRINDRTYTMLLLENRSETISSGNQIPIVTTTNNTTSTQYLSFGLKITCGVQETPNGVFQSHIDFEISSLVAEPKGTGGNPLIRSVSGSSTFVMHPGQKEVVIKADDVNTERRYEVEVLATRVN